MSEELVIRQAAPTLAGIKTGSLFPCPCEDKAALLAEIRAFNRRYQARGLCLLPLRFTKGKALSNLSFRAMEKTLKTLRFRGFFFAQTRSFPLCFPLTGWMQPFLCSETGLPCGSQNPVSCALSRGRKRPA